MNTLVFVLLLLALPYLLFRRFFPREKKQQVGIPGKLIWIDHGEQTKPFFNRRYQLVGKPDFLYQTEQDLLAVEYKSRHGRIYNSDVIQVFCAALAARGSGKAITRCLVKTRTTQRYFDLPDSDKKLFELISLYVEQARQAKHGEKLPATPGKGKCRGCAYNYACQWAAGKS